VKRVLAISAHPDDETLGCGGMLLRHHAEGDEIHWLIVTRAYEPVWSRDVIDTKRAEVEAVGAAYGMASVNWLTHQSLRLDTLPQHELIDCISRTVEAVRPEVVYLVNRDDVHTDHAAVHSATMSVIKPFYMTRLGIRRVLAYETLSSTEGGVDNGQASFRPQIYGDISDYLERKLSIMALFASETQDDPMPRGPAAIRALARVRGAAVGIDYAEAFTLIRETM
jgi:LmbE family N-acetylglucosaminyl deacetylase